MPLLLLAPSAGSASTCPSPLPSLGPGASIPLLLPLLLLLLLPFAAGAAAPLSASLLSLPAGCREAPGSAGVSRAPK